MQHEGGIIRINEQKSSVSKQAAKLWLEKAMWIFQELINYIKTIISWHMQPKLKIFSHSNIWHSLSMGPLLWGLIHLPFAVLGQASSMFCYVKLFQRTLHREENCLERMFKASALANFFSFFGYIFYSIYCLATNRFWDSVSLIILYLLI